MHIQNKTITAFLILILSTVSLISQNSLFHERKGESFLKLKPFINVSNIRPDLIISVTGGLSLPLADLKGDLSTVSLTNGATSSRAYFEKYGLNFGVQGKLPVDKKDRLRVIISVAYNFFTNSGSDSSGSSTIEPKLNFFQFGLGAEYAFMSAGDITPYFNLEANANIFGGSIDFTDNTSGLTVTAEYNRVTRYGFTASGGIEKAFTKSFGGFLGVKYCMANVLGKSSDLTGARELDDDSFVVNGFSVSQRTISFVGIYLGLSLYIRD
ncbi:MAG TPA: hypothetical protein VGK25_06955 [Ignavibacteria bacterium]|jgi:hypothetical protein